MIAHYNADKVNLEKIIVAEMAGSIYDPDVALPSDNTIINPNCKTKFSLPFRKFHELQHCLKWRTTQNIRV